LSARHEPGDGAAAIGEPHFTQNFAPSAFSAPQALQCVIFFSFSWQLFLAPDFQA
jgi:hypothetical protein